MIPPIATARRAALFTLFTATLALPASLTAQSPGQAVGKTRVLTPEPPAPKNTGLRIPAPPAVINSLATPATAPLPIGTGGLPQPTDPPVADGPHNPGGPCTVDYFVNRAVTPTSAIRKIGGSPTAAVAGPIAFQTGNWYAALSNNSGMSWTHVDPYTRFAALDGGFCCNQIALYVPEHDMTVWYLQYAYSATTQQGSARIAIAPSRTALENDDWHSYRMSPQSIGQPAQRWFNSPRLAYSNDYLYIATNVADHTNVRRDAVIVKVSLADLDAHRPTATTVWTESADLGGNGDYCFVQGATNTMLWASHTSTTQMRVFRNQDNQNVVNKIDHNISAWTDTGYRAIAPNGVNWAGKIEPTITGGYLANNVYGFLWTAAARGNRPYPYIRVARFHGTTHQLLGQDDLWSSTNALMYPATNVNARGDIALVLARGDGTGNGSRHPTTAVRIVDGSCQASFGGGILSEPFAGNASPDREVWGNYFTVQQHPTHPDTFVGTGMTMRGGGADANSEPRYLWFGLEPDAPSPVKVTVQDNVAAGSPTIAVARMDLDGLTDGAPVFSRNYVAYQPYELRAPLQFDASGFTYRFWKWRLRSSPTNPFLDQPEGERSLNVGSIGVEDDVAVADYQRELAYQVESLNPTSGIPITVSLAGLNGHQDGTTPFTRNYILGDRVTFTAPAFHNGIHPFKRWHVAGNPQPVGQLSVTLARTDAVTLIEAEFYTHVHGSVASYGQGCFGSNGLVPRHSADQDPHTGAVVKYTVRDLFGATPGSLFIGLSNVKWNGFPLPIGLGIIGADPGCSLYAGGDIVLGINTDASGAGQALIPIPDDPALIGGHFYTQCVLIDPGVPVSLPVIVSNALDTRIGGNR